LIKKKRVKCYICEEICHYTRDCWNPTRRVEENVNLVVEEEKQVTLLLVHDEQIQAKENMYRDNGANNYICRDKDRFIEFDESIKGNVTYVDHSKVSIKGEYMIFIKLKNNSC
jgi:hypothetical protein